jgi:hypothetical protein
MSASVPSRHALILAIQTYVHVQVAELTDGVLRIHNRISSAHWGGALDSSVDRSSIWCQSWGLKRKYLIGCKLLLIQSLLLLLQSFDLVLKGDLSTRQPRQSKSE